MHCPGAILGGLRKRFEWGGILWPAVAMRTDPILTGRTIALRANFGTCG
jgi:hypothetical protein